MVQGAGSVKIDLLSRKLKKGRLILKYSGISMLPTLKTGSELVIESTNQFTKGDLLVFIRNNKLICHRLVLCTKDKCYLKGDANEDPNLNVPKKDILGKVISIKTPDGKEMPPSKLKVNSLSFSEYYVYGYSIFKKLLSIKFFGVLLRKPLNKIKKQVHKFLS